MKIESQPMSSGGLAVVLPASDVSAQEVREILGAIGRLARLCVIVQNEDDPRHDLIDPISPYSSAIKLLRLPFQVGKLAAVRWGISHCLTSGRFDAIAQVDGHLKQDPVIIGDMYGRLIAGGVDLVTLDRYKIQDPPSGSHRHSISTLLSGLIECICGVNLNDSACGTRVYSIALAKLFQEKLAGFGYGLEAEQIILAALNGFRVSSIEAPSNVQADATNAEKILDNFLVLNSYAASVRSDPELALHTAYAIRRIRSRQDFDFELHYGMPSAGSFRFRYVFDTQGVVDAYQILRNDNP